MEITVERVINHPVERVFSFFADVENRPVWLATAKERVKLTEGPVGPGSRFRSTNQMPTGQRFEFNQEVTRYQPNELIEESWDGPLAGNMAAIFDERDGATLVSLRMTVSPRFPLRLLGPLMKPKVIKDLSRDLGVFEEWVASDP